MIEIKKKDSDRYSFKLKTIGGHTLLNSVDYNNKEDAQKTIKTLGRLTETGIRFERKTNYDGMFLFYLKNSRGQLIGNSQLYSSEAGMENGINYLKKELHRL
jgi:hypothetical protein